MTTITTAIRIANPSTHAVSRCSPSAIPTLNIIDRMAQPVEDYYRMKNYDNNYYNEIQEYIMSMREWMLYR